MTGYRIYNGNNAVDTTPSLSFTVTELSPATQYCFTVRAYDSEGNESDPSNEACATTLDVSSPTVTVTSPESPHSTRTTPVSVSGTASDSVGVIEVSWTNVPGGSAPCTSANNWANWTCSVPLTDGNNNITITARDAAANTDSDELTVIYDATGPTVTIISPASGTVMSERLVNITGEASDSVSTVTGVFYAINGGENSSCTGTNSWICYNVPLGIGSNSITITAVDELGNTGTAIISLIYEQPNG